MTEEEAIEYCRKVFNHVGLMYDSEIMRCIGFADDGDDYYYIALGKNARFAISGDAYEKRYCSMVGAFESLKDCNYPRYDILDNYMHTLWGCPRADEFIIERIT